MLPRCTCPPSSPQLVNGVAAGEANLPSFDHGVGDPVPDGVTVIPQNKIILIEGNYLLLGES